jgi:hypothetical protein
LILALREEHRLHILQNRKLRTFAQKRGEITIGKIRLHIEELRACALGQI